MRPCRPVSAAVQGGRPMATHGEYNHIEIPFDDEERAKRFYSGVFG